MVRTRHDDLIDSLIKEELKRRATSKNSPHRSWIKRHRLVPGGILIAVVFAGLAFGYSNSYGAILNDSHCSSIAPPNSAHSSQNKIAVVDALSNEWPAPSFVQTVKILAQTAGLSLDYYNASSTTVSLFMNLPRMGYSLVVFRTHGSVAALSTSEPYSQQSHVVDQLLDRLGAVRVNNQTVYFAITPSTVTSLMCGRFQGTILLAMGCYTTNDTSLADAFTRMGARVFVGWDNGANISHSDAAFGLMLEMLLEHHSVDSSVTSAMHQFGPDPITGAQLRYYPSSQGQSTI